MKKRFIYFLCRIGLYKIAFKISPSIAFYWRISKLFEKTGKKFNEMAKVTLATQEKIENFKNTIQKESNKAMKIKLDDGAIMPTRAHATDAGLDLYARETQIVPAKESAIFDTGVHVELPTVTIGGHTFLTVGNIESKSGLNILHGLTSEGTIDVGYTGSIKIKLYNNSGYDYTVHAGDKISQLVIKLILTPPLELVESLDETERGAGGFGSTGK